MNIIRPEWPDLPANVHAFCTTRIGGVSRAPYDDGSGGEGWNLGTHVGDVAGDVARNRDILRTLLPAEPAWLTQVHGVDVVNAASVTDAPEADAAFAKERNVVCAVMTADCLPVLLSDRQGKVVGAAHAGWRGLEAGVLEATVSAMRAAGADDVTAWLGPAIGPESFEVGREVVDAFVSHDMAAEKAFRISPSSEGKYLADIYLLARQRLAEAGVQQVAGGGWCTVRERRFYSFRRDKVTGRMASLIWIG